MTRCTTNTTANKAARLAGAILLAAATLISPVARAADPATPTTRPATTRPSDNGSPVIADGINEDGRLTLMVNKSAVLVTRLPFKTINIANPDIADFNRISDYEVLVTAKKPGNTQIIIWDIAQGSQTVDVSVTTDIEALRGQLKKILPEATIEANNVNGTIVLKGHVPNIRVAQQAVEVSKPYAENVLNFLEVAGGQQVMLQVRFAEVSRAASSQLGFNTFGTDGRSRFGFNNGPGGDPIGGLLAGSETSINPAVTVFGSGALGNTAFEYFIQALRRNNLLRVLAEPNLITYSGEPASFLAGGEFPIPVPQTGSGGATTITIEYKQFGVRLNFVPIVLGDGKVRLKVEPEVSDLDFTRSVAFQGFVIPSLTTRNLSTTVELSDGQTFAVAGLLSTRVTANKDVTPLLGDLPILGTLFRSTRYERNETELVVLVTPYLVDALNPGQVPALPGEVWRHPTESDLFINRDLGGPAPKKVSRPTEVRDATGAIAPPRFFGTYGFVPAEAE